MFVRIDTSDVPTVVWEDFFLPTLCLLVLGAFCTSTECRLNVSGLLGEVIFRVSPLQTYRLPSHVFWSVEFKPFRNVQFTLYVRLVSVQRF